MEIQTITIKDKKDGEFERLVIFYFRYLNEVVT